MDEADRAVVHFEKLITLLEEKATADLAGEEWHLAKTLQAIAWMNLVCREINPACQRQWPDFRTRDCKQCRRRGKDVRWRCTTLKMIDEALKEIVYDRA